jgi:hypothetical protein
MKMLAGVFLSIIFFTLPAVSATSSATSSTTDLADAPQNAAWLDEESGFSWG